MTFPLDSSIGFPHTYPLHGDLFGGLMHHPAIKKDWCWTRERGENRYSYSRLPITRTLELPHLEPPANSNSNRFSLDFPLAFTLILPLVTRTLVNSNLPLTRNNFCVPSGHFYIILPPNSNHVLNACGSLSWRLANRKIKSSFVV